MEPDRPLVKARVGGPRPPAAADIERPAIVAQRERRSIGRDGQGVERRAVAGYQDAYGRRAALQRGEQIGAGRRRVVEGDGLPRVEQGAVERTADQRLRAEALGIGGRASSRARAR